ncbi:MULTISPECIES: dihydrofolate reductase family protein [unclassified Arthrobacter]|uniref:dihydrofolate reductase family protein n=1 Tax=unclassified Arthrobacter TaxID=235627 RepID=UPI002104D498|nr:MULTISPECIES: dihydrofolate reductase family protein [unclassified Arthrobacter]MCQ1987819.1 dihydrofolate reductase family protein [Arthrobacter sp. zg-Y844]MCQ1996216.1 dihydrofolate reductase family protein [Arthrobacter sp. zg-Y1171]UWX82729.1 dihydrofolate reductase family protein [Arthrobacter sp. zg-Y1171]
MGRLIYTSITSLDGYIADESGSFDWSMPDEEVHSFVNGLERDVHTHLLGRRLYEVMAAWDAVPAEDEPPAIHEYARIWQGADKVVFSRTLAGLSAPRTRLEREFDPAAVRALVEASDGDVSVGGADLAGQALQAGLVDELQQLLSPVIVGGGKRFLPDGLRLDLELLEEKRFANGVVFLRYRVRN